MIAHVHIPQEIMRKAYRSQLHPSKISQTKSTQSDRQGERTENVLEGTSHINERTRRAGDKAFALYKQIYLESKISVFDFFRVHPEDKERFWRVLKQWYEIQHLGETTETPDCSSFSIIISAFLPHRQWSFSPFDNYAGFDER